MLKLKQQSLDNTLIHFEWMSMFEVIWMQIVKCCKIKRIFTILAYYFRTQNEKTWSQS